MAWPLFLLAAAAADPDLGAAASQEVARQECRTRPEPGSEVVVCGRRDGRIRYQVTDPKAPWDPNGQRMGQLRERMTWIQEGDTGSGSCGAVGPGGWTGCMRKRQVRNRQQHKGW
jgi:hypothetical protein